MVDTFRETKPVENSISRAADKKNQYYSLLYAEMAERRRVEENLRRSNLLLQALSQAQLQYVAGTELSELFSSLLRTLLTVTQANQGYLREHNAAEENTGAPVLHLMEGPFENAEEINHFAVVAAEVLHTGRILLLHPAHDSYRNFIPSGSQSSYYFGLPIAIVTANDNGDVATKQLSSEEIVGVIVISGNAEEFDPALLELMRPLVATCAQLIIAHRNDMRRRAAELALAEERALLAQRVAERTAELSYSNAELARTARAKDEFLATMNHELRTPLNAVILYAESLQTQLPGPLNERQMRAVNGIRESANHLLLLINDILDVAKMDAGKLALEIAPTGIENVCQSSLRLVSEMACKKGQTLHFESSPEIFALDADERRLKQMLVNLLSNAVKFTPEGGEIGLKITGEADNNTIHFTVWDTGIGIAQEDITKLFKPFVQLDSSHIRQHGGTGLGLYLVYRMAELHGGSVSVVSEVNRGSRFTISLPWRQAQRPPVVDEQLARSLGVATSPHRSGAPVQEGTGQSDLQAHHHKNGIGSAARPGRSAARRLRARSLLSDHVASILIADDNEANLRVLSDFLQEWNCHLLIAHTGVEAVQLAKEEHPDLILMDIQMPEMNGLDAIRLIRADEQVSDIPIVAVTALAMPGDREQCLAAGADDYLSKPIQIERLTAVLNGYL